MRRRPSRVRPGELVVLGVGLAAVVVAGLTWADNGPWPSSPVRALAAGPGPLGGGDTGRARPRHEATDVVAAAADDDAATADAARAEAGQAPAGTGDAPTLTTDRSADVPAGTAASFTPEPAGAAPATSGAAARLQAAGRSVTRPGVGRMCLLLAPDAAFGAGHNGWAVRLADGRWLEGATENNTPNELLSLFDDANDDGSFYVEPGGDTDSWMRTVGSFAQVRADFRGRLEHLGTLLHEAGYYTSMRCGDLPGAHPTAARAKAREVTASGYWIGEDNCLTKAVDVFTAYGAHLPDATWEDPNDYAGRPLPPLGAATPI